MNMTGAVCLMAIGASLLSCPRVLGGAGPAEGLRAWWQFEPGNENIILEDSNRDDDLDPLSSMPMGYVLSPLGIERAAHVHPKNELALRLPGSNAASHWSAVPQGGVLTGYLAFQFRTEVANGGTIVSRWLDDDTASWRLAIDAGVPRLRLDIREEAGATLSVPSTVVLVPNSVYFAFWSIDDNAGSATLQVYDSFGVAAPPTTIAITDAEHGTSWLEMGRHGADDTTSADVSIDIAAFWTRLLTDDERDVLVAGGSGQRYADVMIDSQGVPGSPAFHLDRVRGAFDDDCRHVLLGDSLVNNSSLGRVSMALPMVRRFSNWSAITYGLRPLDSAWIGTTNVSVGAFNPRVIGRSSDWGCEFHNGVTPDDYYGFPVRDASELITRANNVIPGDGVVWTSTLHNAMLANGASHRFTNTGDELHVRLLYRGTANPTDQVPHYALAGPSAAAVGDLIDAAPRQAGRGTLELSISDGLDGDLAWTVGESAPGEFTDPSGKILDLLGFTIYRDTSGQHLSMIGHDSWAWRGHGQNQESVGSKQYSAEQMQHWLEASSVNPAVRHIFWIHCDVEDRNEVQMLSDLTQVRDQLALTTAAAGIDTWNMLILIPYMHERSVTSVDGMRQANVDLRNAARALAELDDRVCGFSIYDATDGVQFDGRPEASDWLTAHGYQTFRYGDIEVDLALGLGGNLLDASEVHPRNAYSAAFFMSLAARAIPARCSGDVDGDGSVTFEDLLSLLSTWGICPNCEADLDGDGLVGFSDLILLLAGWGDC